MAREAPIFAFCFPRDRIIHNIGKINIYIDNMHIYNKTAFHL